MSYVITQSCTMDASCVVACPVNCIHPAPGEPGFAEAEMLYIDAKSCVGCGACVTACPAGAIQTVESLSAAQQPFAALSAEYYQAFPHSDRPPVAPVSTGRPGAAGGPFRVAVVGAGPAGLYAADELLRHREIGAVEVYERLDRPHGLLRYGVAPDHQRTKNVARLFEHIEREPGFTYRFGTKLGTDVSLEQLRATYDAVIVAVGASTDRRLEIPGEDLPGVIAATDFARWCNGHPDTEALQLPRATERAVIVGNGNLALDVARLLTADDGELATTDMSPPALEFVRRSGVREVVVLGRRGPAEASFTVPELIGLAGLRGVDVQVDPSDLPRDESTKVRLLRELAERAPTPGARARLVFRFGVSPIEVIGDGAVSGIRVQADGGDPELIQAELVVRAIGHRGSPVPGLPFDDRSGTVPHDRGRVERGVYVVGWIKRGPRGFIGTNKTCAEETVARVLEDLRSAAPPSRGDDRRRAVVLS